MADNFSLRDKLFGNVSKKLGELPVDHSYEKYVYEQQGGCAVKIYSNYGGTHILYSDIASCSVDRTTTDIGGSFSITIYATKNWDELIQPDDYIRIFMGDQVIKTKDVPVGAYNVASGKLDQDKSRTIEEKDGFVFVPVGAGNQRFSEKYLVMHERMLGKIDRIERGDESPSQGAGAVGTFTISGRMFGAIIQDTSLYYNEWVPGLNAFNAFFTEDSVKTKNQSGLKVINARPDDYVKSLLSIVLNSIPLPQWQLPESLVKDLNFKGLAEKNVQTANEMLEGYRKRLTNVILEAEKAGGTIPSTAAGDLQRLTNESATSSPQSPFNILSLTGVQPCYGGTFNKSFLSNNSTTLLDLIKHLTNEPFNEFFVDMCPNGDPNAISGTPVPTVVLRQRPYKISADMLEKTAKYIANQSKAVSKFPPPEIPIDGKDISQSLFDLKGGVTVFGAMQTSDTSLDKNVSLPANLADSYNYKPNLLQYMVGLSGHDRLNAFCVLGDYNKGQSNQSDRVKLTTNGGFQVDVDSIRKFGFRVMEISTQYCQPFDDQEQTEDYYQKLKLFSSLLSNWYSMNHIFLNGRIVSRFLPEARLGIPCKFIQTRITDRNPYPKLELFYVQGVSDNFAQGQPLTTTLTVIRGLRYDISSTANAVVEDSKSRLSQRFAQIKQSFSKLLGG